MSSKVGGRRKFHYLLIQVAFFSLITWVMVQSGLTQWRGALFSTIILYYLLLVNTRRYLAPDHWKGIKALKKGDWEKASDFFNRSLIYFENRPYLDRFRCILLMSLSKYSYREMDWINLAFAHGRTGNLDKAMDVYQQALGEFPGNPVLVESKRVLSEDLEKQKKGNPQI